MIRTIPLFERLYPGAVAEFFFDQLTAHAAFADNALNVNEMNVSPGGKQRAMHATVIPDDNPNPELRGRVQTMVFDEDLPPEHPDYQYRGMPKGMRRILEERGLWSELGQLNRGKGIPGVCGQCRLSQKEQAKHAQEAAESMAGLDEDEETDEEHSHPKMWTGLKCCMWKVLSEQADFCAEKPLLQTVIENAGHKCYFLPKFHCELNPIEMFWGWVKNRKFFTVNLYLNMNDDYRLSMSR